MKKKTNDLLNKLYANKRDVIDYLCYHTKQDTVKYFGVTRKVLELFIDNEGLEYNKKNISSMNLSSSIKDVDQEAIIEAYKQGNLRSVCDKFNLSILAVKTILANNNVCLHTLKESQENGCLLKYGVKNPFQAEEIKAKSAAKKLEKYGDAKFVNSAKAKKTNIERYNVSCTAQREEVKSKKLDSYFNAQSEEFKSVCSSPSTLKAFIIENDNCTIYELATKLNCKVQSLVYWSRKYELIDLIYKNPFRSNFEKEVVNYISSISSTKIITNDRKILAGKEIDIYLPEKHIGIECNGTYYHSSLVNSDKNYHFNKSKATQEQNIRLIHIYEHEWLDPFISDKIKSMLAIALGEVKTKVYARQCSIKKISNKDARPFNELNHLQGHRNAKVTYGLYYNDKLVQLMSFSPHKKYEWEIIRGCPASNNIVVGGVSKLFKHFIKEYSPNSVFSYCDFNKFDGKGYESIGMKFIGYTGPDMKWLMPDYTVVNRCASKHAYYSNIAIAKLWGAGSKKYLYTK